MVLNPQMKQYHAFRSKKEFEQFLEKEAMEEARRKEDEKIEKEVERFI